MCERHGQIKCRKRAGYGAFGLRSKRGRGPARERTKQNEREHALGRPNQKLEREKERQVGVFKTICNQKPEPKKRELTRNIGYSNRNI